jgi:predicted Zn-dependent peptidase
VSFDTGSIDDRLTSGITRATQHALVQANLAEDCLAFHRAVFAAGGSLTLLTEVREASFVLTAPRADFEGLAKQLLKLLLAPKLDKKGFERAIRLTLNDEMESGGLGDLFSFIASSVIMVEGGEGGGDYNTPPYGEPETVRGLSFKDVVRQAGERFTPANATVVVAGGFKPEFVPPLLARATGGKPRRASSRPDIEAFLPMRFDRWSPRELHLRAQVVTLTSPRRVAAARVLPMVLNDAAFSTLRPKGLTYTPMATTVVRPWLDFSLLVVPVANTEDVAVEPMLDDLVTGLAEGKLADADYESHRAFALAEALRVDRDSASLAQALATGAGRVAWHTPEVVASLRAMTKEDFLTTVKPWLEKTATIKFRFGKAQPRAKGGRR